MMYKIGDFSKITNLTIEALRYCDAQGILVPSSRDDTNSCRFYNEQDFKKAEPISLLRSLDFSIAEIRDVLYHCETEADLSCCLKEKQQQILDNMAREENLLQKIAHHFLPNHLQETKMNDIQPRKPSNLL